MIGRTVRVFLDETRNDPFTQEHQRSIVVSVYVPIQAEPCDAAAYISLFEPAADQALDMLVEMGADRQHMRQLTTNTQPVVEGTLHGNALPVIIYAPAFGVVKDMYSYNVQRLVESGFIVIAVGSTHESIFTVFPDGTFVKQQAAVGSLEGSDFKGWKELLDVRVQDIAHVLARLSELNEQDPLLRGKLDLDAVGIIGHSLGGAAAMEVARTIPLVKVGVMMDASFHLLDLTQGDSISTPLLVIRQEKTTFEQLDGAMSPAILAPFLQGYARLHDACTGTHSSFVRVKGAYHMTFCDVPLHFNEANVWEKHEEINRLVCPFMEHWLHKREERFDAISPGGSCDFEVEGIDREGKPCKPKLFFIHGME